MSTEYIYHGRRYWTLEPKGAQLLGWNTEFVGCPVFKKTAKRVGILSPDLGVLWLNREVLERDGKVYHSKPHEYFYAVKPAVDPEAPSAEYYKTMARLNGTSSALLELGLAAGSSQTDIKRAYKRLARKCHPDSGGSHEAFLRLDKAYKAAMKSA